MLVSIIPFIIRIPSCAWNIVYDDGDIVYDVVYVIVYDIVRFLDDIVRTTYDIAIKRTISYVFYLFLPVVRATSYPTM